MLHYVINSTEDVDKKDIDYEEECEQVLKTQTEAVTYTAFEKQVAILFEDCFDTLVRKDVEYAGHGDAFEAFREAAKVEGVIPEEIARRYRLKHDMSLMTQNLPTLPCFPRSCLPLIGVSAPGKCIIR